MQNDKNKSIYQASDRNYPLNEMRQDLVDNWLNDDKRTSGLLEYELSTIKRTQTDKECDQSTEENQDGTFRPWKLKRL